MDYEKLTDEELEKQRVELGKKKHEIMEEQHKVISMIRARGAKAAAERKFADMDEFQKKEMAQLLGVKGIASKEKIGKP